MHVTAIIAAAGEGRRLGAPVPKQLLEIGGRSILERSVGAFVSHAGVHDVIVVLPAAMIEAPPPWMASAGMAVRVVAGGARRQDSVANAFDRIGPETDIVLIHDAARPFVSADMITRTIEAAAAHGAAIPVLEVRDTVKRIEGTGNAGRIVETIPRESIVLAQTPQGFRRDVLAAAIALGRAGAEATDEAALAEKAGRQVHVVAGDAANIKITTADDLELARQAPGRRDVNDAPVGRAGTGYDLHRLVEGRPLILGGVTLDSPRGALGHSDADVVCHAATDAILGAACLGDIGRHFPDTDPRWKGASSLDLLARAAALAAADGYEVANVDVTVVLEAPKIRPYVDAMRAAVARALGIDVARVSIKGKTNEGVDAVGRGEAVAAHAVALLRKS